MAAYYFYTAMLVPDTWRWTIVIKLLPLIFDLVANLWQHFGYITLLLGCHVGARNTEMENCYPNAYLTSGFWCQSMTAHQPHNLP